MEALSFTVLVAHGGVGVATAGYGGRRWFSFFSPLFRGVVFFLFFFGPPVNSVLASLGGFVEVMLLVAAKRKTGGGTLRTLLRFLCIFFFFLLPFAGASLCFSFFSVHSSFTHPSLSLSRSFSFFFLFSSVHLSRFFFSVPLSLLSSPLFHSPSPFGVRPPFPKLPPCCSVPSLAFIARECMRFPDNKEIVIAEAMVTVGDGRGVRFSLAL